MRKHVRSFVLAGVLAIGILVACSDTLNPPRARPSLSMSHAACAFDQPSTRTPLPGQPGDVVVYSSGITAAVARVVGTDTVCMGTATPSASKGKGKGNTKYTANVIDSLGVISQKGGLKSLNLAVDYIWTHSTARPSPTPPPSDSTSEPPPPPPPLTQSQIEEAISGPVLSVEATAALGPAYARYDSIFAAYSEPLWVSEGADWSGNYYDRGLVYYAEWARSKNPIYFERGTAQVLNYRRNYVTVNNFIVSGHWGMVEGLYANYRLTGDDSSRYAIARVAKNMWESMVVNAVRNGWGTSDPRVESRVLTALLMAKRVGGHPDVPPPTYSPDESKGFYDPSQTWDSILEYQLSRVLAWQTAEGVWPDASTCMGQWNFMAGLMHEALAEVYQFHRSDPRILTAVDRGLTHLWTQWTPGAGFNYSDVPCPDGGVYPAGDLTGLMVSPFGWLARTSGNSLWRVRGDEVFQTLPNGVAPYSKQFNQAYTSSWRYFGYR